MIIIGELINSTRKSIAQAIERKDSNFLQDLARRQAKAGANYIDVNTASTGDEIKNMIWVVDLIQEVVDVPLCIDSPNPLALEAGLARCRQKPLVNSISAETERWDKVLPLIQKYGARVVALCMDNKGMPETMEDRLRVAEALVNGLTAAGVPAEDIFLDPLVKPLGVYHDAGIEILNSARTLKQRYPDSHLVSGLSNVSFGLPERRLLNRAFLVMSVAAGMDAFILDPLDQTIMSLASAAYTLAGHDEYCMEYISGVRAGKVKA